MEKKPLITENTSQSSADDSNVRSKLTVKQQVGDAANKWLARNRSLVLRQTPAWAQGLTALMLALGGTALLVGIFFRIDEVVTVQGQLKSIGGTIEVKTPAGGKVAEVLFNDGDNVQKGQLLLRFDTRQAKQEQEMLVRVIAIEKKELKSQVSTINSQEAMLLSRVEVLKRRIKTKSMILKQMETLVEEGGFQRLQYLEQKDELFQLENQLGELLEQQNQLNNQVEQIQLSSTKSINEMETRLKAAELQLQYQNVNAPVSGIVFDPQASADGVMSAGERIVSIVPQKGLYAEVYVPNNDIGYIKVGQEAKVRVDAFPFTRYGDIAATVSQIAADALEPKTEQNFYRFPVKLRLSNSYLISNSMKVPLKSGMSITTNLKLRDKRVISLLSDMLVDQADSVQSIRQQ
ncbi:HlyD family secretion protein [Synechococcus sp. BL107]|uniref:HlyD family secretion protein n=1 Tax=Synechococcus sp. BL107 TaxID=313625 RepID=UPI0002D98E2A|nr:HlyD family efflux transporter periplasmic adaptor subunit [Synechococcus sp. BL107]